MKEKANNLFFWYYSVYMVMAQVKSLVIRIQTAQNIARKTFKNQ
jgi:hypothetical protein